MNADTRRAGTLFVVAKTRENGIQHYALHALQLLGSGANRGVPSRATAPSPSLHSAAR
jgi:uncharacterized membrane protein (UPF0136 family)